jgi:hypothetical protein
MLAMMRFSVASTLAKLNLNLLVQPVLLDGDAAGRPHHFPHGCVVGIDVRKQKHNKVQSCDLVPKWDGNIRHRKKT